MRAVLLLILLFLPVSFTVAREETSAPPASEKLPVKIITGNQAKKLLAEDETIIVIDVRTPAEFAEKHLENARNINFFGQDFEKDILKLPRDAAILLYCKSGRRSDAAAEFLLENGFTNIMSLKNGMAAWEDAGVNLVAQ